MTAPDLTRITGLLLTKALDRLPNLDDGRERWSLSDDGAEGATLWRHDPATDDWLKVARVSLTVDVKPRTPGAVVVGGVVYTGEEGVTA